VTAELVRQLRIAAQQRGYLLAELRHARPIDEIFKQEELASRDAVRVAEEALTAAISDA
jgi:hypothetical protein